MTGQDDRMAIGAFARATGVTTSALRFYDDCDLVRPDAVDAVTGYRYYSADQVDEVVLIRRLREVGLPLGEVRRLLDAPVAQAEEALAAHLRAMEHAVRTARAGAAEALAMLGRRHREVLTVAGRMLAEAIGQVVPAAAPAAGEGAGIAVLSGVLLEVSSQELRLVATDRYRLAVRSIPVGAQPGWTAVAPAQQLDAARPWLARQEAVQLRPDGCGLRLDGPGGSRTLPVMPEEFPRYRMVLDGLPRPAARVVVPRALLLAALGEDPLARLDLVTTGSGLTVRSPGAEVTVPAEVTGSPTAIRFRSATLRPAVAAGVGPDVMIEIARADLPAVVRSADDGDLTTLVMPILAGPDSSTDEGDR